MPNIRHEVLVGAPAERVFRNITGQEGLAAWWTPEARTTGARGSIARFPFGPSYFKEMEITDVVPPRHVAWTCIAGCDEWLGTKIAFELHAGTKDDLSETRHELADQIHQLQQDEGALVMFRHDGWREYTPMFAECNYTWARFLRSLKVLCETGIGRPWPRQHRVQRQAEAL